MRGALAALVPLATAVIGTEPPPQQALIDKLMKKIAGLEERLAAAGPPPCSPRGSPPQPPDVSRSAAALFDDLSPEETAAAAATFANVTGAAVTAAAARAGQPFITGVAGIELLLPRKEDALAVLNGTAPRPPARYARVTCARPLADDVMEYRVGPITGRRDAPAIAAAAEPLLADGAVPYTKRPFDPSEGRFFLPLINDTVQQLRPLVEGVFGPAWPAFPTYAPENSGMIIPITGFPALSNASGSRVTHVKFFWVGDPTDPAKYKLTHSALWLHPLPFTFHINETGHDWETAAAVGEIYFCKQGPFASAQAVLAAHASGALRPCPWQRPDRHGNDSQPGGWDVPQQAPGTTNPRTARRAPLRAAPDGARYATAGIEGGIGRQVSWLGWEFFASVRPSTGLSLWDVRFQGRRVAYEISLGEAGAVYGGGQGDMPHYLDSAVTGLGQQGFPLHLGVDCPLDATLFRNTQWQSAAFDPHAAAFDPTKAAGVPSACIFEEDTGAPLWSHGEVRSTGADGHGVRGSQLVVRSVANSGNYDYYNSAVFSLDGSFRWETSLAGFCETTWIDPKANDWESQVSTHLHPGLGAPVHTHLINVKVDLDIDGGASNSFEHLRSVVGYPDDGGDVWGLQTKHLKREYMQKESGVVYDPRSPQVWRVVARSSDGPAAARGSPPGYAIVPGETMVNTWPADHPFAKFMAFSKYTVAVTRRRDEEQRITSWYDLYDVKHPITSIDAYMADGESVDGTDVVAWVTLPHEHIPRTEDVPLITNYKVSFSLLPWDYHAGNQAMDIPQDPVEQCLAPIS